MSEEIPEGLEGAIQYTLGNFTKVGELSLREWDWSCLVAKYRRAGRDLPPYEVIHRVFDDILERLEAIKPEYADILRARYWEGLTSRAMLDNGRPKFPQGRSKKLTSEQSLVTYTQGAVKDFATLFWQVEQACRQERQGVLSSHHLAHAGEDIPYFTGREELLGHFYAAVAALRLEKPIWVIEGISGIGKTSLLNKYWWHCYRTQIAVGFVSATPSHTARTILIDWATNLKASGILFENFINVLGAYQQVYAKVIVQAHQDKVPMADVLGEISTNWLDWLYSYLSEAEIASYLQHTALLTHAFLADLELAASNERLVLILDRYEQVRTLDDWVHNFAHNLRANVLFVIAGQKVVDELPRSQRHSLELLDSEKVRQLLRNYCFVRKFTPPTPGLMEKIVRFAHGLPQAALTAMELWSRSGKDFDTIEIHALDTLIEHLRNKVVTRHILPLLDAATVVRYFNRSILRVVSGQQDIEESYEEIKKLSFVETSNISGEGIRRIHDGVRGIFERALRVEDPARYRQIHQAAADYFASLADNIRVQEEQIALNFSSRDPFSLRSELLCLTESLYHGFFVAPARTLEKFVNEFTRRLHTGSFEECRILLQASPPAPETAEHIRTWLALAEIVLLRETATSEEQVEDAHQAITTLLNVAPPRLRVQALQISALINIDKGHPKEALGQLLEAVELFDTRTAWQIKASVLKDLGGIHFLMGNAQDALACHQKAEQLYLDAEGHQNPEGSDSESGAQLESSIFRTSSTLVGGLYARTGKVERVILLLEQRLAAVRQAGDRLGSAKVLNELALAFRRSGQLEKAKKSYTETLAVFEEFQALRHQGHTHCGLGMTLEQGGNTEEAYPHFQQALALFEQVNDSGGQAKAWYGIARRRHKAEEQETELALQAYEKSLQLYKKADSVAPIAAVQMDMAALKVELGQFEEAIYLCKEAAQIFEGLDDQAGLVAAYTNLGIVAYLQNQVESAVDWWKQARSKCRNLLSSRVPLQVLAAEQETNLTNLNNHWVHWLSMYDPAHQAAIFVNLNKWLAFMETRSI